jgi:hypothetical protein
MLEQLSMATPVPTVSSYWRLLTQFFGAGSLSVRDILVMISSELRTQEPPMSSESRVLLHRSTRYGDRAPPRRGVLF